MNKQLAKITRANLEIKERGILNFWIFVSYDDGGAQGVGGIALDEFDKEKERRVGSKYGCEMIRRLLITLDVDDFAQMVGKHVWVYGDGEGLGFTPKGIGLLKTDEGYKDQLIFNDVAKEFIDA